ncbi:BA75_04464T0 [Komagataella pastoris]|uniref:Peptide-methionine (R)-S-oxide reductase n=1 Tax=Komagataella pastoris TaxID=4922 RepID=A0A1B2JII5_PICPA|nr:BA75_04464T0 [Komagataella pastoris]
MTNWKAILTPAQYQVIRLGGTERPYTGQYVNFNKSGTYLCGGCQTPLYKSSTKFDSSCGWPAFYEALPGAVKRIEDNSLGMRRIEIRCAKCDGHLGHVFEGEGFDTPTDSRHCVNSISLKFQDEGEKEGGK